MTKKKEIKDIYIHKEDERIKRGEEKKEKMCGKKKAFTVCV